METGRMITVMKMTLEVIMAMVLKMEETKYMILKIGR